MSWTRRSAHLYVNHRITTDDYEALLKQQDYKCAICGTHVESANLSGHKLSVDHDHKCCPGNRSCGKCVRGLLCKACNSGLGHFKDNIGILISAVRYLDEQAFFELEDSFELSPLLYTDEG